MKFLLFFCIITLAACSVTAQSSPSIKVHQAFSSEALSAMTANQLATLEFRAEKLCWFEQVKNENQTSWYTLVDLEGNSVAITDAMVLDFNPLLYNLPQQSARCENLPIQTTSGNQLLLIVRSEEMMQKEWERHSIKQAKSNAK